jgi:hypothetical protein
MLGRTVASVARRATLLTQVTSDTPRALASHTSQGGRASSTDARSPRFSEGEDPTRLRSAVNDLLENQWNLDDPAMGVSKTFYFKNFGQTMVCFTFSF